MVTIAQGSYIFEVFSRVKKFRVIAGGRFLSEESVVIKDHLISAVSQKVKKVLQKFVGEELTFEVRVEMADAVAEMLNRVFDVRVSGFDRINVVNGLVSEEHIHKIADQIVERILEAECAE